MRYFRFYSESLEGEVGSFYCEVSSEKLLTRQIDVFGTNLYWASPGAQYDERYSFTDQPEFNEMEDDGEEISCEFFESLWAASQKQQP